jgi:pyruvate,water dikinase
VNGASAEKVQLAVLPRELGQVPPSAGLVGGKAARLSELLVLKARVPRFGVVSVHALDTLQELPEVARLLDLARGDLEDETRRIAHGEALARALQTSPAPADVARAIEEVVSAFPGDDVVAVRASVAGPPAEQAAMAGALETLLAVPAEGATEAVQQVMASALGPDALSARYDAGLDPLGARVAVIVQRMVASDVSGTCLSSDVLRDGAGAERVRIEGTFGLSGGSSLGPGERRIVYDRYSVPRPIEPGEGIEDGCEVESDVREKQEAVRADPERGSGTKLAPIDDEQRHKPTISNVQARLVAAEALRLEAQLGRPQRLAFAFAGRLLHVLEAQPLLVARPGLQSVRVRTWDRRLVPSGLAGRTTPLSYSFARRVSGRAARAALDVLDVKRRAIEGRRAASERLLGWLGGHAYVNTTAFQALLELLPSYEESARAVAFGFGVPELVGARTAVIPRGVANAGEVNPGRTKKLAKRVLADSESFLQPARERLASVRAAALDDLDPDRLLDHLDDVEEVSARSSTSLTLLSCAAALGYNTTLRVLQAGGLEEPQRTLNDLLGGEPDERSLGLARALRELVSIVDEEPVLDELFSAEMSGHQLWERLEDLPQAPRLRAALDRAIEHHGHDVVDALKLETPTFTQRPGRLLDLVRAARGAPAPDLSHLANTAMGMRKKAEFLVQGQLKARAGLGLISKAGQALEAAGQLREVLALREATRAVVADGADAARRVCSALGDRLFEHELVDQPSDVYFLTAEELRGLVRGTTIDTQPRALVAARKREASRSPLDPGDRLETQGAISVAEPKRLQLPGDDGTAHTLFGIPICSGEQTGRAVVLGASARASGRVTGFLPDAVVVIDRLDPGVLPALSSARAVVVEGASVLDPVAVTLRALGVPVVGGIARATEHVEPGEPLHVDGGQGKVHLVLRMPADEQPETADGDADHFARLAAPSDPEVTSLGREPRLVTSASQEPPAVPTVKTRTVQDETTVADAPRPEDLLPRRHDRVGTRPPGPPPLTDPGPTHADRGASDDEDETTDVTPDPPEPV